MFKKSLSTLMVTMLIFQTGCYNTYTVPMDEFRKIQESDEDSFKTIKTGDGKEITITENSRVGVTDKSGQYYPISPFNFTLNQRQLVAPDDDLLLSVRQIEQTNVKLINPTNTTLLIVGSTLALVGAAVGIILATPKCDDPYSFTCNN